MLAQDVAQEMALDTIKLYKPVHDYYDAGATQIKKRYLVLREKPAVLQGYYKAYYANGQLQDHGHFLQGKPDGPWKQYHASGELKADGFYQNGVQHGHWKFYYESGVLRSEGQMHKGQLDGEWKYYFENGALKQQGLYAAGKACGLWTYMYENGLRKAQAAFVGDTAYYKEQYEAGMLKAEGALLNGKSIGVWKYYHANGKLKARGQEQDGVKTGLWHYYHDNDSLESEGLYANGVQEGNWKYYHRNGKLETQGQLNAGQRDGKWQMFYETGELKGEGNFSQGDGPFTSYYPNGKLKAQGKISKGLYEGQWQYYDEEGRIEGRCNYQNGEGDYTGYYPDGKKRIIGRLKNGERTGTWQLFDPKGTLVGYYKAFSTQEGPLPTQVKEPTPVLKKLTPRMRSVSQQSRHFKKSVNEQRGFIVGANPLAVFLNSLPVSVEYHWKQRLGYELTGTWLRNPFLAEHTQEINREFSEGFSLSLRQKLYFSEDPSLGSFYWAQEFRYTYLGYRQQVLGALDSTNSTYQNFSHTGSEQKLEVSLLVGTRIYQPISPSLDMSLDIFAGLGTGYRMYTVPAEAGVITTLPRQQIPIAVRLGIMLGIFKHR